MACNGSGCACKSADQHDSRALADVGGRVLTIGTFDGLHFGHLRLFQRAAEFGRLIVGVNSDQFVEEYKGAAPVVDEYERYSLVGALTMVYGVHINHDKGRTLVRKIRPEWLVVGSDWHERDYLDQIGMTQAELDEMGVKVVYLPRTPGVSSSERR